MCARMSLGVDLERGIIVGNLIGKEVYDCPFCEKLHEIEVYKRNTKSLVDEIPVEHQETYYYCPIEDEAFFTKHILGENLLAAKDSYRKTIGRLTSNEIKDIRKMYNLSQKEFSNMLGWGDVTVQRYEKKSIQDETYDEKMRMLIENPQKALKELEKHKNCFTEERYKEVASIIKSLIKEKGIKYLKQQVVESIYLDFNQPCEENGWQILNLNKVEQMVRFFAQYDSQLYKVKLMKLLWYADALFYKRYGKSMSGLVYKHLPLGAVPLGHEEILSTLENIEIIEEYFNEHPAYKIKTKEEVDLSKLDPSEIRVLHEVMEKFKDMGSRAISVYMHEEGAYKITKENEIISYFFTKGLKEF